MAVRCRDARTYERKIKKAHAKKNRDLAQRLAALRPTHRLDHLVKDRCSSPHAAPAHASDWPLWGMHGSGGGA